MECKRGRRFFFKFKSVYSGLTSATAVNVGVDSAKSEIKVERRCDSDRSAVDFAESVIVNTVIGIVIVVNGHGSARTVIVMPVYDGGIRAYMSFLVDTVTARGGTTSRGTRRGTVIRCLTFRRQVVTTARRLRGRSRVNRTGNLNDAWRHARNQRRIATPPDCTCTKAIDNVAAYRIIVSKRACRRVSLLTRMKDVISAAD